MGKVIATRLARLVATLLAVTFLTFSMTALLPGDPVNAILGVDAVRDPEVVAKIRADLGLDDPFLNRYVNWLGNAATGDLGQSYITDQEVMTTISQRLPVTAQLAFMAILMAVILAIPIGMLGAYKQGKWQDATTSAGV
ncbi:MAG: ABC transporter permease, partial [Ilumatobacteraceae bacterium]